MQFVIFHILHTSLLFWFLERLVCVGERWMSGFPSSLLASTDPSWYIDSRKMLLNAPFFRLAHSSRASFLSGGGWSGGRVWLESKVQFFPSEVVKTLAWIHHSKWVSGEVGLLCTVFLIEAMDLCVVVPTTVETYKFVLLFHFMYAFYFTQKGDISFLNENLIQFPSSC